MKCDKDKTDYHYFLIELIINHYTGRVVIFNDHIAILRISSKNRGELSAELTVIVGFNTLDNESTPTSNRVSDVLIRQ